MTPMINVFIDGQAGTTGLQIQEQLQALSTFRLITIAPEKRKDPQAKLVLLDQADIVILCLHDEEAKASVQLIEEWAHTSGKTPPKIIDTSTAHRVDENWVYGFPELSDVQSERIRKAKRVANPGCYATGAIALLRPLVDAKLLPADYPVTLTGISGYSGGGRSMIEAFESGAGSGCESYSLGLSHKHIPEIMHYAGLTRTPLFVPTVSHFKQGMLVHLPLHLDTLPHSPSTADIKAAFKHHYAHSLWISVEEPTANGRLNATDLNDSNHLEIRVFEHPQLPQVTLVARLDNLGKGASRAAVQNLQLMTGVSE